MRYVNRLLAWFRASARTVGLSPKILAPAVTAGLAAVVSLAGLTPGDLGQVFGVSPEVVLGAELVLGTKLAIWLLPAGKVVNAPRPDELGSDASQPEHIAERLAR
jgi:hypothetical protein